MIVIHVEKNKGKYKPKKDTDDCAGKKKRRVRQRKG